MKKFNYLKLTLVVCFLFFRLHSISQKDSIARKDGCELVKDTKFSLVDKYVNFYNKLKSRIVEKGDDPRYEELFSETFGTIKQMKEWDKSDLIKLHDLNRAAFNNLIYLAAYALSNGKEVKGLPKLEKILERRICAIEALTEIMPESCKSYKDYIVIMRSAIAEIKARPKTK